MVGAPGFEPGASCAQGNCKKSISLVRLALFCVMVLGFGANLSALGPKWTQVFSRNWADGRQARSEKISCLHIGTDSIVARLQDRSLVQSMKMTPSLVAVIVVVALVLVVVLKFWGQGGILPPHEFAYGTAMRNSDAIAERMDQFLSLEALDPKQVQIQT